MWKTDIEIKCKLCNQENESRNHLFFHSQYSRMLLHNIITKQQVPGGRSNEIIDIFNQLLCSNSGNKAF